MSNLFQPLSIKNIHLKNRIGVSPMCMYSAEDGFATNFHLVHLGSRAIGGAALIIQEATAVSPEGRISPGDLGIWKDGHLLKLSEIASFITEQGSVPGIQLAHAGRKGSHEKPWDGGKQISSQAGGWITSAPSAIPFREGTEVPLALDKAGIQKVINDFRAAAGRALHAGYKIIELHAAHGYLIHQFLSPLCNTRTDEYGGSFENRTRLIIEIISAIKEVWPNELPLFVRISASDWAEGGWNIDESVKLATLLKEKGVDLIDCSSGGAVIYQKLELKPGYQVPFSERIRKETGILTAAVGLITEPVQAEEIITSGQADIILFARELLRDPYYPLHAAKALGEDISWPVQYERAR